MARKRQKCALIFHIGVVLHMCVSLCLTVGEVILADGTQAKICDALETTGNGDNNHGTKTLRKLPGSPNVCAVEEVMGSRKRYYSECMTYMPRKICEKPTFIRYHCCTGFEKAGDGSEGCQGVAPIENLMDTAKHLYLKDFRKHAKRSGASHLLAGEESAYTVFTPHNKAFSDDMSAEEVRNQMSDKVPDSLTLYHMVNGRYYSQDLKNEMELPTNYKNNATVKFNRYSNGILTANCARVILPNQIASNGVLHVTEKIVEPQDKTVMDILLEDDRFGEMVTALIVTEMGNDLRGPGPYTVFAIHDEAFANAPQEVIDRILNDETLLKKFLKYHILDKSVCSAAILGPTKVKTEEGQKIELSCNGEDSLTVDGVVTDEVDMVGTNGVVHVINELIVPDSVKSLKDVIQEQDLYEFLEYAQQAGLSEVLEWKKETNMTLLVPSADAFAKLTSSQRRILQTQPDAVARVFKYHAIPGKLSTRDLVAEKNLRTDSDDVTATISVSVFHNKEFGVSGAKFESTDHEAGNGMVHVIDRVLFPPEGSVMDKIGNEAGLSTFSQMLEMSGLSRELIISGDQYTIFAPSDNAFEAMDTAIVENLMKADNEEYLKAFLNYHMLRKPIYTSGVRKNLRYRFKTQANEWLEVKKENDETPITINGESAIITEDLISNNGVVHVIDTRLWCPCLDELSNTIP